MRPGWLAAAILAISTSANADVTARYDLGPEASPLAVMTIEVNDRGDARFAQGNQAAMLVLDGVSYMISADLRGTYVARFDDLAAIMAARFQAAAASYNAPKAPTSAVSSTHREFVERGTETVGGRSGTIWSDRAPRRSEAVPGMEIVINGDADLAPVGRFFARQFASSIGWMRSVAGPGFGGFNDSTGAIAQALSRGTPIRMGHMMRLQSVDSRPIPASEFVLPSEPLTRAQLEERLGFAPASERHADNPH